MYALEQAYRSIREGECDMALVGSSNLCLHPFVSLQFFRLGVLSKDGSCKSFDESGWFLVITLKFFLKIFDVQIINEL